MDNIKDLDLELFIPYRLSIVSRLAQALLASALESMDLTVPHWRIFICVNQYGTCTLSQIAEFTRLPQSSLSRSISRMNEKGYLIIDRDLNDKRNMKIEMSTEGVRTFEAAIFSVNDRCNSVLQLDDSEEIRLHKTLDYLIKRLQDVENS
ncbi:MarR family transcriptional regulator [Erwinia sp. S59]|uniref:MarR family winged helix-turn-helix transcriptional regulator n=1 Tax=Erwinia sp. S59 TaxID=2769340 RepID=UPI00190A7BDE|nr:MarR family transcriptional regulator [Erwinia sp. S59]MBK0094253.1 MarR family transcriptional regulator [Erwinia sp. S59]